MFNHEVRLSMSPVLPFDIATLIIDVVGENKQTDLLKELALVSHSFLQICSKHLFAAIALDDARLSSKRGFVKLLKSRPEVVKYIRKLAYNLTDNYPSFVDDDRLSSSMLPNILRSIPHLNFLTMTSSRKNLDWKRLNSSLTSALLHLMHLPSINRIDLSNIKKFPLSSLIPCVNLLQLDIFCLRDAHEDDDDSFEIIPSEVMPKLREFNTTGSAVLTRKLLHAKMQDGRPAYNPMNLRRLAIYADQIEDNSNIRYLLQNAKLLQELHLPNGLGRSIVGLHDILSPTACTLKVLHLTTFIYSNSDMSSPTWRLCEELEAMAGHNVLKVLTYEIVVRGEYEEDHIDSFIGTIIRKVGEVLTKPGWSALRQVSFELSCLREDGVKLKPLRSLADKYLSYLSKLDSVQVAFSCRVLIT